MTKQKIMIYLASAVLLMLVIWLCVLQAEQAQELPVSFVISFGENEESIELWEDESGAYYIFLPSYADLSQLRICLNTDNVISINTVNLKEGMDCTAFSVNIPYDLSYDAWGKGYHQKITFLQSANVASMFINTESGSMDYVHEDKGNKESGSIALYLPDGTMNYAGNLESVQGRGNTTWGKYEKKPYSIKLSEEADLLDLGKAQNWVLLANASDPTNLRNKIVYEFADAVGLQYSPDSDWVDVYLNGEYAGLYLLSERNEVHSERVDIAEDGSVLVSQELASRLASDNRLYITTDAAQAIRIHYPIIPDSGSLQRIKNMMQSVENAILSEDGVDPVSGRSWSELIDVDSWVRKFLIEEIFANTDACAISQFFYVDGNDQSGKLCAGPVWDYDLAMGNTADWCLVYPRAFYANRQQITPWMSALCQKEAFYSCVQEIYQQEYLPLLDKLLREDIYVYADHIAQAAQLNQIRWFTQEENAYARTEDVVQYMNSRIAFLNGVWIEERPYHWVVADQSFGANYAHYIVFSGERLTELYEFEDTEYSHFLGWYYKDTDEPFDITQPITEDIEIYAKWEDTYSNRMDNIPKLIPLGIIAVMGVVLLWVEVRRMKKSR